MLTPEQAALCHTPKEHVELMNELAAQIAKETPITSCVIDDYGRFSNFSLFIQVSPEIFNATRKNILTQKINAIIDRVLQGSTAHRRETFSPESRRVWNYGQQKMITEYTRKSWAVDVDFQRFDASSNHFTPM